LKNMIRDNLFKINNNNYDAILEELKSLNYTCEKHFELLASELIIKSMNDAMACKGIESAKATQKTPSEIYMSIALEFSNYLIKQNNKPIKFKTVLSKDCESYFTRLTNSQERMDQNNPHRVSNYKGFMNMIGLMYIYKLFPKDIVKVCFNKILKLILDGGLSQDECDNYYSGYERLMNRILTHFEKVSDTHSQDRKHMFDEFNGLKDYIKEINNKLGKACEDDPAKPKSAKPLRLFSIMTQQQNVVRFNKLVEIYGKMKFDDHPVDKLTK